MSYNDNNDAVHLRDKVVLELNESWGQTAYNIYGADMLISRACGGTTLYYLYNGHGDVVQLAHTTSGAVMKSYDYDAFGKEKAPDDTDPNPFRYCGEYYDKETGTYYLRARYYDPAIGRFTCEDTVRGDATDPLKLHLYTYCGNDPVNNIDPSGNMYLIPSSYLGVVGGLLRSLASYIYNCYIDWTIDCAARGVLSNRGIDENDPYYFFYYSEEVLKLRIAYEKQEYGYSPTAEALATLQSFDVKGFSKEISKMPPGERVATVKQTAKEVADKAGLKKDTRLSKLNGRDVYVDPKTGNYYSVDTQHGRFEIMNSRGKHLGECDFSFKFTKPADTSGAHNLIIK